MFLYLRLFIFWTVAFIFIYEISSVVFIFEDSIRKFRKGMIRDYIMFTLLILIFFFLDNFILK